MKLIKKKIKYFLLIYFKNKKKYIYNIMIYTIIKNLKNYLIKILPDLITFFLIFLKFFKTFYFVKIVLTQIPMCNTYQ